MPKPSTPSQVVHCRNGSWDPVSFGCVEDDGQKVMCGGLPVGDIAYGLNREPRTVASGGSRLEVDSKVVVNQVVVWVLGCAQGYDSDGLESVTCIDGRAALYPSSDTATVDTLVHGNITTAQRTALQAHALNVVSLHYYNGNLDEASAADLGSLSPCVRVELADPEAIADKGLSDTVIVVVFFASAFAAVITATLAVVFYRNRCFQLNRSSS
ncbi:MAG: uncharacterized protein KVP18_002666 [Porospora cf. gigantea A]|nr:MAG: hypothetical protein KVP18_002666 [Porospora cf. gigantea A]